MRVRLLGLFILLLAQNIHGVELKSYGKNKKTSLNGLNEIHCQFIGLSTENKKLLFPKQTFKFTDLKKNSKHKTSGVLVNLYDFMDFRFSLSTNNTLIVKVSSEENPKSLEKKFRRVPASFSTKVDFAVQKEKKNISIKEVKFECGH